MNYADDNSMSWSPEAILTYRYQFRAKSIEPSGTNCVSINIYMVGVCVHANPADGQPTQFARDFKLCWGLTSPRQFRTLECGDYRNYDRRWQRLERNKLHVYIWGQILASLRSSIITHVWTRAPRC